MQEADSTPNSPTSRQQRHALPPLAPRNHQTDCATERAAPLTAGRPPRLSHRSRAGCWTCRGRKVKCDEKRPICGPCARLNRECDWDHRWNFNDATIITQGKHTNVTTAGNVVWDPSVRTHLSPTSQSRQFDDLPAFDVLKNDEERERKAETYSPGTFGVVVTPESFADLPEYASVASPTSSRHGSVYYRHDPSGSPHGSTARSSVSEGSTTIILQHFEDVHPTTVSSHSSPTTSRRSSFPDYLQELSISASLPTTRTLGMMPAITRVPSGDDHLLKHFRRYIVPRLIQPASFGVTKALVSSGSSTQDIFEKEALRFRPLHHAMCAVSALNLAYSGRSSLEEAMQHYQESLTSSANPTKVQDMLSDAVFLRHFLLFIYDLCVPITTENGGMGMWEEHLGHLQRLAIQRRQRSAHEPLGYIIWTICELDMYAAARGCGNCDFISTIVARGMIPELHQHIPDSTPQMGSLYHPDEAQLLPLVLELNQRIVIQTAKLAQLGCSLQPKESILDSMPVSPGLYAQWHAAVSQGQADLLATWTTFYPNILGPESVEAGSELPPRVRFVFEHTLALFYAAMIYSRTSMFSKQRLSPAAKQPSIIADTEHRCGVIVGLARNMLTDQKQFDFYARRRIVFPIFMAGFATSSPIVRRQALDLLRRLEGCGSIGQNTFYTRKLLMAVAEAQQHANQQGIAVESVEWLSVARESGLNVVNCGL